ncbi:glutamate carboxypeptidase [Lentibacillus halodurans]|uniref:Glutamate carboxypeptidase n=1 Tax=Lentibacillus halodurans TaxID=237679 RepID=A0A1I0YDH0_9BACI|nr:M20 family metallopeptidase [Lentibacillus halodurans]SFB10408.1 glutamate carboxypeptidase [Lentibacillus halodurans]
MIKNHSFLENNQSQIKAELLKLTQVESPSNDLRATHTCANVLKDLFQEKFQEMFTLTEHNVDGRPHIQYEIIDSTKPRILFLSHFDTVWKIGELEVIEQGDRIYGPGVFDMKAGLLSSIWAIYSLTQTENELPISPVFLFTSDEEIGSLTSRPIIEDVAKSCDAVFIMEPPEANSNALKTERKGVGIFHVSAKGVSAHAGNHHEDGVNAILEMAKIVQKLESLTDYECGTTVNVGTIRGGSVTNVVPDTAEIDVDLRFKTADEGDRIKTVIETLTPEDKRIELRIEGDLNRPPLERNNANQSLYTIAEKASQRVGIKLQATSVGGGSDGNFTSSIGVPTLDGLGIPGDGPHARHENIRFDMFVDRCSLVAEMCLQYSLEKERRIVTE